MSEFMQFCVRSLLAFLAIVGLMYYANPEVPIWNPIGPLSGAYIGWLAGRPYR